MRNGRSDIWPLCLPLCLRCGGGAASSHLRLGADNATYYLDILTGILITISGRSLLKLTQRHTWTRRQPAHHVSSVHIRQAGRRCNVTGWRGMIKLIMSQMLNLLPFLRLILPRFHSGHQIKLSNSSCVIFAEWVHFDPALFRQVLLSAKKCSFQSLQFTMEGNPVNAKHKTHQWTVESGKCWPFVTFQFIL